MVGKKHQRVFRIVLKDSGKKTILKYLGTYNPHVKSDNLLYKLDIRKNAMELYKKSVSCGAQCTPLVKEIFNLLEKTPQPEQNFMYGKKTS